MSTTLLKTKLHIPPVRPDLVSRPRSIERLDCGLRRGSRLTLISAPAGYGKTTLITEWLSHLAETPPTSSSSTPVLLYSTSPLWLSLDKSDNDPIRFFTHLVAALSKLDDQIGLTLLQQLEAATTPANETIATLLINDLDHYSGRFLLVLDDYHTISELGIHDIIDFLLDYQPPQMHLVITTRHDPPLALSRLRGRGQVTEIRQNDIRFTTQEAATFLNQSMGLQLSEAEISALDERTEGWIAGLQLAALSLQGCDLENTQRFIESFSGRHHHILDYLTDEILKRQPHKMQRFLLHTSILDRLCGPLCDAVLGLDQTGKPGKLILQSLEAANLFVVPLDDERKWYRYHHLFADLLRAQLRETQPGWLLELHKRAATWYEGNDLPTEAVKHALATHDFVLAADFIQRATMQLHTWSRADAGTLLDWLTALPDHVIHDRPWLRLFLSRTYFTAGQGETAERFLCELEVWLRENPSVPDSDRVLGLVAADWASYAVVRGDLTPAIEYAKRALAQLPAHDAIAKVRATSILGMAYFRAGNVTAAWEAFSEAIEVSESADMPFATVPFLCNQVEILLVQGKLQQALETCQKALFVGTVNGARSTPSGFVGLGLGKIYYERNDLETAEKHLLEGLELLGLGGLYESFGNLRAVLALVKQSQGDESSAKEIIQQAVQSAVTGKIDRITIQAAAYQARVWLSQGNLGAAARWAKEYQKIGQSEYLREFEDLILARVFLAQNEPAKALELLDSLLRAAKEAGRMGRVIEIQAIRALAFSTQEELDCALEALSQSLHLAEPEGYTRTFVDEGAPMARLLRHAKSQNIASELVDRLLGSFAHTGPLPLHPREQPLIESLSDREMEVLLLLSEELTNPEIAQRLTIALATVKSHTRNLYGKLGVGSRKQAVSRAQALGIITTE